MVLTKKRVEKTVSSTAPNLRSWLALKIRNCYFPEVEVDGFKNFPLPFEKQHPKESNCTPSVPRLNRSSFHI